MLTLLGVDNIHQINIRLSLNYWKTLNSCWLEMDICEAYNAKHVKLDDIICKWVRNRPTVYFLLKTITKRLVKVCIYGPWKHKVCPWKVLEKCLNFMGPCLYEPWIPYQWVWLAQRRHQYLVTTVLDHSQWHFSGMYHSHALWLHFLLNWGFRFTFWILSIILRQYRAWGNPQHP